MDGWVGGLQLFGLSLKGKKTVDVLRSVLNRASEEAADYLIDEVFSIQPERMKRFLCATTLLTRFNTDLCSEATGMPDACEVFAEALKNNLFLVPLDSEGEWYRYHPLFSKAVRKRAFASGDETSSQVYRTAALWFARHGYLEDAFRHAFASGDFEFAADMLEDFLMVLYERYDIASFRRWIHKLPRDVFASRALLRLFDCRFKIESVQLADVSATLDGIERRQSEVFARYEGHKRRLCQDLLLVLKRILPDWCDPENAEIESLEATLRQVSPGSRTLSAFWTMVPFSYFYKGRMSLANDALKQASSDVFASGNRSAIMVWFRVSATVERFQGRLHRSEEVLNKAFRYFGRNGLSHPQPRFVLDSQMAWIHYMRNDIERAHEAALAVLRYLDQTRFLYEIADVNHLLSLISLARGEADRMGRCTQRMERAARDIGTPGLIAFTEAHAARLAIATGDLERARKWMKRRKVSITEPFSLRFVTECLADAELCSAEERHRDALMVLNNLRGRCLEENMMEAVFEIDLRLAASLYAINDRHSARMVMQGALFFSEPEGYLRPFVERASSISPVLMDLARTQGKGQSLRSGLHTYLNAVSRSCGITEADLEAFGEQSESLAGALTRREVEILELMAAGYRDKEIAEKAFISLHTAKTHIKHILEKLGATTRVQAIRRAEELKNRKNR
jgi:LuxR family maltose regulon positive regulatory protein